MITYVTGFLFSSDRDRVVLIEKLSPAWQRGLFNGVGGKIEANETPNEAICREFYEEAGEYIVPSRWTPFVIIERTEDFRATFLFAFGDEAFTARSKEKEQVSLHLVSQLPANVIHNLRWLIPLALDKKMRFDAPLTVVER